MWLHGESVLLLGPFARDVPSSNDRLVMQMLLLQGWSGSMAINGQTQPQKFSLYRHREGKSDPEHGKWFKRQHQGGPNKRTMQRLLPTLGLVAISLRSSLYAEVPALLWVLLTPPHGKIQ